MNPEESAMLKRGYRNTKVVFFAFAGSIFCYGFLAFLLSQTGGETASRSDVGALRMMLWGLSIAGVALAKPVGNLILRMKPAAGATRSGDPVAGLVSKLVGSTIVSGALNVAAAVYGLLIFLLTKSWVDFFVLAFSSLVGLAICLPRFNEWESWVRERGF